MKVKQINNRFKVARLNAGYTQRDVERILQFISFQALSLYEHGACIPSNMVLYSLPKLYHVSLDYLLYEDDFRNHEEFIKSKLGLNEKSISILMANLKNPITIPILKEFITCKIQNKERWTNGYRRKKN